MKASTMRELLVQAEETWGEKIGQPAGDAL